MDFKNKCFSEASVTGVSLMHLVFPDLGLSANI